MKAMVKIGKNGEAKTYEIRNENEYLTMLTEIGEINHIRGNASAQMFNYAWFRNITKINPTIQFQIAGDPRPAYVTVVDEKKPTKLLNLADLETRHPRVEHDGTTYLLTARGQELFGGETGMEIDIDGLHAVLDANPSWSLDADGEPIEHTLDASLDVITYDGEVVARRNW